MTGAASGTSDPWRLRVHESLPSTSDLLLTLAAAGEPEGLAVLAKRQTAGRGRQGRNWESESGNLHLSVLLRPRTPLRLLPQWSLLAGVALVDALRAFLPDAERPRLRLKWPNDVLLDGAKCAGILLDAGTQGEEGWLVIGCGANLTHAPAVASRATAHLAAAGIAAPPVELVAERLLDALGRWRRVQLLDGFAAIRAAWLERGPERGTLLTLRPQPGTGQLPLGGRFEGLSEDGGLLLASGGRVHAVLAGEILG
ncbi:biotin--[acetyl-CoA-carboxylase] ligase [Roseomonas sp. BN140053]|uniref:biotin--[acetyl-CoA-carboxylase] ligase n=1 Tax=Roseomonas sp. BN140053 TaxID=3391898 RepID=UPI0039E92EF8